MRDNYRVTEKDKENIGWLRERFREWACDACRAGDLTRCTATEKDARVFIELPRGDRRYFCNIGCMLLQLPDRVFKEACLKQFDREGHYDRLVV